MTTQVEFAGAEAEQEDDITLVTLERLMPVNERPGVPSVFGVPSEALRPRRG